MVQFVQLQWYVTPYTRLNKFGPRHFADKSDIWALGIILYELCTLKYPFNATNQGALVLKICKGVFAPISSHYSAELKKLVDVCLQRDPQKRPSAYQLLCNHFLQAKAAQLKIPLDVPAPAVSTGSTTSGGPTPALVGAGKSAPDAAVSPPAPVKTAAQLMVKSTVANTKGLIPIALPRPKPVGLGAGAIPNKPTVADLHQAMQVAAPPPIQKVRPSPLAKTPSQPPCVTPGVVMAGRSSSAVGSGRPTSAAAGGAVVTAASAVPARGKPGSHGKIQVHRMLADIDDIVESPFAAPAVTSASNRSATTVAAAAAVAELPVSPPSSDDEAPPPAASETSSYSVDHDRTSPYPVWSVEIEAVPEEWETPWEFEEFEDSVQWCFAEGSTTANSATTTATATAAPALDAFDWETPVDGHFFPVLDDDEASAVDATVAPDRGARTSHLDRIEAVQCSLQQERQRATALLGADQFNGLYTQILDQIHTNDHSELELDADLDPEQLALLYKIMFLEFELDSLISDM
jgi:hypothetical protein